MFTPGRVPLSQENTLSLCSGGHASSSRTKAYSATDRHAIRPSVPKNRVYFVSRLREELFFPDQCGGIVADIEHSIISHSGTALPNTERRAVTPDSFTVAVSAVPEASAVLFLPSSEPSPLSGAGSGLDQDTTWFNRERRLTRLDDDAKRANDSVRCFSITRHWGVKVAGEGGFWGTPRTVSLEKPAVSVCGLRIWGFHQTHCR